MNREGTTALSCKTFSESSECWPCEEGAKSILMLIVSGDCCETGSVSALICVSYTGDCEDDMLSAPGMYSAASNTL